MCEVHPTELVLIRQRLFRAHRYVLPRAAITRLREERLFWFMFSGAIRIEHSISEYPRFLFWSRDVEVLTLFLARHDYPVATPNA